MLNDMMYHSTAEQTFPWWYHQDLVQCCVEMKLWKGLTQGPGTPSRHLAMPEQCAPSLRPQPQRVTTDWESKRQDQQVLSQEVPLCKGIQYDTRQSEMPGSMPKACVSTESLLYQLADLAVQLLYLYPDPEYLCETTTWKTCPLDNLAKQKWGTCTFSHYQIWNEAENGGTLFLDLLRIDTLG